MRRWLSGALLVIISAVAATGAGAQATWTTGDRPTLEIGAADGPPLSIFHDIRGVITVDDTLIVVADGGSRQLRMFTSEGRAVAAFGREGDGPGEFRRVRWVGRCGGPSIVVFDALRQRVTKWDARGDLIDGFNIESTDPGRPAYALNCGPTGEFVVVGWFDVLGYQLDEGPYRPRTKVGILGPNGGLERLLGTFPGPERYRYASDGLSDGPRPFGKPMIARMGPDGALVGTGDAYTIEVFQRDGPHFTVGKPHQRRELTRDMLEAWQDSVLSRASAENRGQARRALDSYEMPETLPAYSDFRFDDLGLLWVALFPAPGQDPVQWDVWDASRPGGVHIASIQVPRHFQPMEIGADYLLGVSTDSLGVQRVHRYRLSR